MERMHWLALCAEAAGSPTANWQSCVGLSPAIRLADFGHIEHEVVEDALPPSIGWPDMPHVV
jgi:hypothetical protein